MRLRLFLLVVFLFGAIATWACSLNPQPYPPDNYDASTDATLNASPDAVGGGTDATPAPEDAGSGDAETPSDGSSDAADAEADADADAADAEDGAAVDAGDQE